MGEAAGSGLTFGYLMGKVKRVKRIAEHYTWDKVTDGYEELFRELVAGKYPCKFRL
jgi:hypothetical protein